MTSPTDLTAPTDGQDKPCSEAGFTLLEMMIVLLVLALIAGLALTRGPPHSPRLDLRASADEVAQSLRVARSRAIVSGQRVVFTLDPAGHRYWVNGAPPRALPPFLALGILSAAGESVPGTGGISFAPDGSSSGGRIALAEGDRRLQVGVDWLTGRVAITGAP